MHEAEDMSVITCKVLVYVSDCAKRGAYPTVEGAYAIAGKPFQSYWSMVIESMLDKNLIKGEQVNEYMDGSRVVTGDRLRLTLDGEQYLNENAIMQKVKKALGAAFKKSLEFAVAAAMPPSMLV